MMVMLSLSLSLSLSEQREMMVILYHFCNASLPSHAFAPSKPLKPEHRKNVETCKKERNPRTFEGETKMATQPK
jgi:hypothetical protein